MLEGAEPNPRLPAWLRDWLLELWRGKREEAGSDGEAWELVAQELAGPQLVESGPGGCLVLARPGAAAGGFLEMPAFYREPLEPEWWREYGVGLPADERVPLPAWSAYKELERGLDEASSLFFRRYLAAYRDEQGVTYVQAMLDLGDRPLSLVLSEDGTVALEAPLENRLPADARIRNYVLERLAYDHASLAFRVDGGSILVARRSEIHGVRVLPQLLGEFVASVSFAVADLRGRLEARRRRRRQYELPGKLRRLEPCIRVSVEKGDGGPAAVFRGPLLNEGLFNLEIPREALGYILSAWDYHCQAYERDKKVFAYHYLSRRMPSSLVLVYRGVFAGLYWAADCRREEGEG